MRWGWSIAWGFGCGVCVPCSAWAEGVCPLNRPAGEEGAGVQGAFGSLTGGAEHGPGSVAGMGVLVAVGPKCSPPLRFSVGGHDHAVARRHYVCSWSKEGLVRRRGVPTVAGLFWAGVLERLGSRGRCRSCRDRSPSWVARRGLVRFRVEPTAGALRASRPSPDDPRRSCNAGERAVAGRVRSQGTGSLWCGRPYVAPIERRNPPCGGLLGLGRTCP